MKMFLDKVALYRRLAWPLINVLARPNPAHDRAIKLAERVQESPGLLNLVERLILVGEPSPRLRVDLDGVALNSPLMLAAGFDKESLLPSQFP